MPSLKLVYFDGKGRGEPIRWILAAGGQAFEQEKFSFEQWPAKKPSEWWHGVLARGGSTHSKFESQAEGVPTCYIHYHFAKAKERW